MQRSILSLFLLFALTQSALGSTLFAGPKNEVAYQIAAELNTKTHQVSGHEHVKIKNHTGGPLSVLYFHVYPNAFRWEKDGTYVQEAIAFGSTDLLFQEKGSGEWIKIYKILDTRNHSEITPEIHKELMTLNLSEPLQNGAEIDLEMDFITQVAPVAERLGYWDGNYTIGQWFPKLMVYDKDGWALKHNADYHFMGEFYGDFGPYDVELTVPSNMKVGATGHLTHQENLKNGKQKLTYHAENVHDFAWVGDVHFLQKDIQVGKTTIHVLYRNVLSKVIGDYAQKSFEYYSKRIGEYPYEDFTVAETYYNAAMEYPQLVFIRSWPQSMGRKFERDYLRLYELTTAHETSHQWFYGVVGNNEVKDAWLDEGFATFLEESFMHDQYGTVENIVKFTSLFKVTDAALGEMIWRLDSPNVLKPIQTPSYEFSNDRRYYSTVYYRTSFFFRHFEALVGREKLDQILREYFKRNTFRNASPENWYEVVREFAGPEAERWWKTWINNNCRSDYALKDLESEQLPNGHYKHTFVVSQEGDFYAPVDVELRDKKGDKRRLRANISEANHHIELETETDAPIDTIEVDPDHVAADINRFNNVPGVLPRIKIWPFTTRTLPSDAITLGALPYVNKRPGIGIETGVGIGVAQYLDWYAYGSIANEWRHNSLTTSAHGGSIEPDSKINWTLDADNDDLIDHQSLLIQRSFNPTPGVEPQHFLKFGPERFGDIGDGLTSMGVGGEYQLMNLHNGRPVRYSLTVHNTYQWDLNSSGRFDRLYIEGNLNIALGYLSRLNIRGYRGRTFGVGGKSSFFDLQSSAEGGMRFDNYELGLYKVNNIRAATVELSFPVPNASWFDSLGIFYTPSWEWHIFSDVSNGPGGIKKRVLFDAGIGTRLDLAMGGFIRPSIYFELVPYQNALEPTGWGSPLFYLGLASRIY